MTTDADYDDTADPQEGDIVQGFVAVRVQRAASLETTAPAWRVLQFSDAVVMNLTSSSQCADRSSRVGARTAH